MSSLREQLHADGEYFKRMLSLIPASWGGDSVTHSASLTDSGRRPITGQLDTSLISYLVDVVGF